MRAAARALGSFVAAAYLLATVLLVGFGLLQTPAGQTRLAGTIAQLVSDPEFTVAIDGLRGTVPFRVEVDRIEIGDRDGTYLTLRGFGLDIAAPELLARRVRIRSLSFAELDMARPSTAPPTTPPIEYLNLPHLPVSVFLDRLSIERLNLAPLVLGDTLVASIEGNAQLAGGPGAESRPTLTLDLSGAGIRLGGSGAEHAELHVSMTPPGTLDNPASRRAGSKGSCRPTESRCRARSAATSIGRSRPALPSTAALSI